MQMYDKYMTKMYNQQNKNLQNERRSLCIVISHRLESCIMLEKVREQKAPLGAAWIVNQPSHFKEQWSLVCIFPRLKITTLNVSSLQDIVTNDPKDCSGRIFQGSCFYKWYKVGFQPRYFSVPGDSSLILAINNWR